MASKSRPGFGLLFAAALLAAAPARAAGLTEAQVRDFVAQQERAWNAGALDAYFGAFRPDAVFTDQYRTPGGQIVPYGSSTLGQAKANSRRFRATAKVSETGDIRHIALAADGRSAHVVSRVVSRTQGAKGLRVTCAERRQDLVLAAGRLRSQGQTDTFSRCPR
jgi:hypothetical protein